jgi:predicted phosphate transport protein (TIGR00153 family)
LATRKLLLWMEKRKRSRTLNLAQQQISLAMSTVGELDAAIKFFSENKHVEMDDAIKRLFEQEKEIDLLRRQVLEELAKRELPSIYREDLKRLVGYLDEFADQVKDSARGLKVAGWPMFPKEIMDQYLLISRNLVDGVRVLGDCIEAPGVNPAEVRLRAEKVCHFEDAIDEGYLNTKILFLKYGDELEAVTLVALRDLLDYMEQASDTCARTADYLRVLAASELP